MIFGIALTTANSGEGGIRKKKALKMKKRLSCICGLVILVAAVSVVVGICGE